jgi:hypothetical protein
MFVIIGAIIITSAVWQAVGGQSIIGMLREAIHVSVGSVATEVA